MATIILVIVLWFYLGEMVRLKFDADGEWTIVFLYIFAPIIHLSIFFWNGAKVYFSKDWENL